MHLKIFIKIKKVLNDDTFSYNTMLKVVHVIGEKELDIKKYQNDLTINYISNMVNSFKTKKIHVSAFYELYNHTGTNVTDQNYSNGNNKIEFKSAIIKNEEFEIYLKPFIGRKDGQLNVEHGAKIYHGVEQIITSKNDSPRVEKKINKILNSYR